MQSIIAAGPTLRGLKAFDARAVERPQPNTYKSRMKSKTFSDERPRVRMATNLPAVQRNPIQEEQDVPPATIRRPSTAKSIFVAESEEENG